METEKLLTYSKVTKPSIQGLRRKIHIQKQKAETYALTLENQFAINTDPDYNLDWEEHVENTQNILIRQKHNKQTKLTDSTEVKINRSRPSKYFIYITKLISRILSTARKKCKNNHISSTTFSAKLSTHQLTPISYKTHRKNNTE